MPGHDFLDTARGINPILDKLPHSIQEQWMSKGSQYKKREVCSISSFFIFAEYVCQQADMRKDPSIFLSTSSVPFRGEKSHLVKSRKAKTPFTVNRTEVEKVGESLFSQEHVKENPDKQCPLYKKKTNSLKTFQNEKVFC